MDSDKVIYCNEDDEYRVYCDICDKLCIERFYNNIHKQKMISNNII